MTASECSDLHGDPRTRTPHTHVEGGGPASSRDGELGGDRYADGWRDCALSLAAAFDQGADDFTAVADSDWRGHLEEVTEADAPTTAKVFRRAAGIARQQARNGPAAPDGQDPASSRTMTREQLADALTRVKPAAVPQDGILEIDAEAMATAIWEVLGG